MALSDLAISLARRLAQMDLYDLAFALAGILWLAIGLIFDAPLLVALGLSMCMPLVIHL